MKVKALRSFPYTDDGVRELRAVAGEEFDCPSEWVEGLRSQGYVEYLAPPAPPVEIAAPVAPNYETMHHKALISLAQKRGGKVTNRDEALAFLKDNP